MGMRGIPEIQPEAFAVESAMGSVAAFPNRFSDLTGNFHGAHKCPVREPERVFDSGFRIGAGLNTASAGTVQRVPVERVRIKRSTRHTGIGE